MGRNEGTHLSWKEFSVYTTNDAVEAVSNLLNEYGANGVVIIDKTDVEKAESHQQYGEIYDIQTNHYPNEGAQVTAYFYEDDHWESQKTQLELAVKNLEEYNIPLGSLSFETKTVKDSDWENEWKNYFHVHKVTNKITIVPSWETYNGAENELLIHIDPGMAFGTGTHPTTVLSLQALEKLIRPNDLVLDVGVGSGVLSIGACLLGAAHVYGYDLDPVAVKSAAMNRKLNGLDSNITLEKKDLLKLNTIRADIVVSNILAEILVDLVDDAYEALHPEGYFITSGIIQNKISLVEDKMTAAGFTILDKVQMEEWISIIAQKKG